MFRSDMFFLLASRLVEKTVVVVGDSITPTHLQPLPYFWNHKRYFFSPGSSAGDRLGCKYIGRGQEGWRGRCGQGGTPPGWLCHSSLITRPGVGDLLSFVILNAWHAFLWTSKCLKKWFSFDRLKICSQWRNCPHLIKGGLRSPEKSNVYNFFLIILNIFSAFWFVLITC